jgi:WD40 repeat protein
MVWGLSALVSMGMLYGMEEGQKTVFSREYLCLVLNNLSAAEKNEDITSIRRISGEFVETIVSCSSDTVLQKIVSDSAVENALGGLSQLCKKLLVEQLVSSKGYPFRDEPFFFIGRKELCSTKKSYDGVFCFKSKTGAPVFRVKEDACTYTLYEGILKKQTLIFSEKPSLIAWNRSGALCAYLCSKGNYFQPLPTKQTFIKRSLCDSADSLTALALHPDAREALLGLDTVMNYIFSDGSEFTADEHTASLVVAQFSHDGTFSAVGDAKGIVSLWSEKNMQQRFISHDTTPVTALGFDAAETGSIRRLLVGYESGFVRLWDSGCCKAILECAYHTGNVLKADLIGSVGITLGSEGVITFWESLHGIVLRSLECDPIKTSWIVAQSIDSGEAIYGDELIIIAFENRGNGGQKIFCDRYDFDMITQCALLAATHEPGTLIQAIALARAAKKYEKKRGRSAKTENQQ